MGRLLMVVMIGLLCLGAKKKDAQVSQTAGANQYGSYGIAGADSVAPNSVAADTKSVATPVPARGNAAATPAMSNRAAAIKALRGMKPETLRAMTKVSSAMAKNKQPQP